MNYFIRFLLDGRETNGTFEADDPGAAFALCLKAHPDAVLVKASSYGNFGIKGERCEIHYDPPPVQRSPARIRMGPRKPKKNDHSLDLPL